MNLRNPSERRVPARYREEEEDATPRRGPTLATSSPSRQARVSDPIALSHRQRNDGEQRELLNVDDSAPAWDADGFDVSDKSQPRADLKVYQNKVEWHQLPEHVQLFIIYLLYLAGIPFEAAMDFIGLQGEDLAINRFIKMYDDERKHSRTVENNIKRATVSGHNDDPQGVMGSEHLMRVATGELFRDLSTDRDFRLTREEVIKARNFLRSFLTIEEISVPGVHLPSKKDLDAIYRTLHENVGVTWEWKQLDMGKLTTHYRKVDEGRQSRQDGEGGGTSAHTIFTSSTNRDNRGNVRDLQGNLYTSHDIGTFPEWDEAARELGDLTIEVPTAAAPGPDLTAGSSGRFEQSGFGRGNILYEPVVPRTGVSRKPGGLFDFAIQNHKEGKRIFKSMPVPRKSRSEESQSSEEQPSAGVGGAMILGRGREVARES